MSRLTKGLSPKVQVAPAGRGTFVLCSLVAFVLAGAACRGVQQAPEEQPQGEIPDQDAAPTAPWSLDATALGRAPDLQLEDLSGKNPLEGRPDLGHRFSYDGRWLFFLRPNAADAEVLDLWRMTLPAGKPEPLATSASLLALGRAELTEAQRSEKERRRVRHRGITSFALDRAGKTLILPLAGFVYRVDLASGKATRVFATARGELDPRPSPDGARLAFVRKGDLWIRELGSGAERPLTRGGSETLRHGVAEFVAQEELDRHRGHWWSPDGAYLALTQVDEAGVQLVHRHQISATGVKVVPQRYPAAGTSNAKVRLGVATLATGQVRWIGLPGLDKGYLARVSWTRPAAPGRPPRLFVQTLSRDQRELTLDLVDPVTLAVTRVLVEQAPDYVNLHDDLRPLAGRPALLWTSEASGLRQLYAVDLPAQGAAPVLLGPATPPPAPIPAAKGAGPSVPRALSALTEPLHRIEGVDDRGGWVYATSLANRGRELHLYRFALSGARLPERLTREPGWHEITMSRAATHYVDRWSDLHRPPRVTLHRPDGSLVSVLSEGPHEPLRRFRQAGTRFVTVRAKDGTPLNALLFTPPGIMPGQAKDKAQQPREGWPAVIYVYGGPHGQTVARRWHRTTPWHHLFAQRGFAVLLVDGRGSAHRGKAFETKLWRRFGVTDVEDVAAAAHWLGAQPGIDRRRLGLWGWSYGGYLTAMTLFQTGRLFRAGVAVAPVADWRLYDTAYTERYLGMPGRDEAVYRRSDPVPLAPRLAARLLLLHGMADDNVLLTHTLGLASALQKAERPFDMMLYPGKAHSIQGTRTRRHLLGTLLDYFQRHLGRGDAPAPAAGTPPWGMAGD